MTDFLKRYMSAFLAVCLVFASAASSGQHVFGITAEAAETVTLRVCNWEEYFDLGDWDEDEVIELSSGDIIGVNPMVEDFEDWYYETYGKRVKVEYSTFGTNEDLYNMLTLGDVYDLVCPSEYMTMKLMKEEMLVPLSDDFFDEENEYNYYTRGVSPFIRRIFDSQTIGGEPWSKYMAGYMWGVTGIVYNPELVTKEQASSWKILADPDFHRQVTIKDNVRDAYFAAVGAVKSDLLTSEEFRADPDYAGRLEEEMNDCSPETIAEVETWLKTVKDNAFSFETDAGKADMITGKVAINYQWSGDGVYTMEQADEDDYTLAWTVPEESTDIYFDGWVMLRRGIEEDPEKQHAAEAFINFISRPDNAIRNMYYTGYISVLSGGDDPRLFEYAQYNYEAEDDEEDIEEYDVSYFFADTAENDAVKESDAADAAEKNDTSRNTEDLHDTEDADEAEEEENRFVIYAPADQVERQLSAAYPPADVIGRASVMRYFDEEENDAINRMWINVRCYDIRRVPMWSRIVLIILAALGIFALVRSRKKQF